MNILFIHEVDWLKKVVFEIHDWSEILSKEHNVFAIDYEDKWKRQHFLDIGTLKTKEFKHVSRSRDDGNVTLRRPGMIKLPFLSRASSLFTHYLEIKRTMKEERIDAVILYSVPTDGLQTILLAKKYNIPVIFRSIDAVHQLVSCRFLRTITHMWEKGVYKNVDKILTLTPKLSEYVIKMGANENKVELLPAGVNTNRFNPNCNTSALRKELGISKDDKVIMFVGTLFKFSQLDQYIERMPSILEEIPTAKLLIVGGGDLLEKLKMTVVDRGLKDKVILTGFQPYEMVPGYITIADVCINPFQLNEITKDVLPMKVLQYLACGKPVTNTLLPGLKSVFPDESCGIRYSKDIPEMVRDTINLLRNQDELHRLGQNGREYIKKHHDLDEIAKHLEETITTLIQSKAGDSAYENEGCHIS